VLADFVEFTVGRARQADVLEHARHFLGLTGPAEQELVDLRLPRAEPRAAARARGALLVAVAAIGRTAVILDLLRLVHAVLVVRAQKRVRARDAATTATR